MSKNKGAKKDAQPPYEKKETLPEKKDNSDPPSKSRISNPQKSQEMGDSGIRTKGRSSGRERDSISPEEKGKTLR